MSIRITKKDARCPEGCKLASRIVSYLFEQECGECRNFSETEVKAIRRAAEILMR